MLKVQSIVAIKKKQYFRVDHAQGFKKYLEKVKSSTLMAARAQEFSGLNGAV